MLMFFKTLIASLLSAAALASPSTIGNQGANSNGVDLPQNIAINSYVPMSTHAELDMYDALKENGDKFDANQKAEVEKLKDELQQALNNNDYTTLKTKLDALEQAAQQMSQAMYQQQANNSSANNSNNDYMDADFKEKN